MSTSPTKHFILEQSTEKYAQNRIMNSNRENRTINSKRASMENVNELVGSNEARRIRLASAKGFASGKEKSFRTDKYQTKNSSWTPVVNPYCNNQLYQERVDLIGHWYSMWTDAQRKNFLKYILQRSTKLQHKFVKGEFFSKPLPVFKADFTTILPRFLSMYIFSYLDPRSLSRAARVSWHWKFISEQDEVWMAKGLRLGWFLPYTPTEREYGSWKHHYIICTHTLDKEPPSQQRRDNIYSRMEAEIEYEKVKKVKDEIKSKSKDIIYFRNDTRRPHWIDTDTNPKDLYEARKALLADYNPNQSISLDTTRAERLGLTRTHHRSLTAPSRREGWGRASVSSPRKRSVSVGRVQDDVTEDEQPIDTTQLTLTEALAVESELKPGIVDQPWLDTIPTSQVRRKDLTVGTHPSFHDSILETGRWSKAKFETGTQYGAVICLLRFQRGHRRDINPSIILISSEIPACEVLLESVLLGAIAIPYQYESATLESLTEKMKIALMGRQARSIGLFCLGQSGSIRLTQGQLVSDITLQEPNMKEFCETMATSIVPRSDGGHLDVFIPLTETEPGMDLLVQLGLLTDMQISCPTGMTGSFSRVETEWLYVPDNVSPPALYFDVKKLNSWSRMVEYLEECTSTVRAALLPFFNEERLNVARKTIGQVLYKSLGLQNIEHLSSITSILAQAIQKQQATDCTREDLINHVIKCLQNDCDKNRKSLRRQKSSDLNEADSDKDYASENSDNDDDFSEIVTKRLGQAAGEKRTLVAQEILHTETEYMDMLNIVHNGFKKPLHAALNSNRAIISLPNIKALFDDMETLLTISCVMVDELSKRLEKNKWDSHECVGDIFLKFTTTSRAYTNFLNSYPVTLNTLQRCKEQNPQFRSFLSRHERQPTTKMMSFAEFLLLPGQRINSYVNLLQRFLRHTPSDHVDRRHVTEAIAKIQDIADIFKQYEERLGRETFLQNLQKTIVNCPVLSEKGRHFICSEDVALLTSPTTGKQVKPEYRYYLHSGDAGLFLFNDALVVASLTYQNVPFKRLIRRHYKFQACVTLKKLKIQNVADTRYLKNAFVLVSPKRMWICQASCWEQKLRWMSILESTISSSL